MKEKNEIKIVCTNHQAYRDFFVLESYEAGLMLVGCEVKSLRENEVSLAGSFAHFEKGELFLYNLYVAPYIKGNRENEVPLRPRKLLLHRNQLLKIAAQSQEKGLALVPLKLYFNDHGVAKIELGVGRGKKFHDKRFDIKKSDVKRDIDRAIKNRNRK